MKCHEFSRQHCLSCDLMSLDYSASIGWKENTLNNLFSSHAKVIKPSTFNHVKTEESRNKAKLAVAKADGEIQFGFYEQGSVFKKLENCPLQSSAINNVLGRIKELMLEFKIVPYDLVSKTGEMKYLMATYSESNQQLLLRFVLRSKESLDRLKKLAFQLTQDNHLVKVVTANIQPVHQAILEGEEELVLTEKDYIIHQYDDYALFQGPRSFFQTNTYIAHKLYSDFQLELKKLNSKSLLDLYCGVGAFSFFASRVCDNVMGVEISPEAIKYANLAKLKNNITNVDFLAKDAEEFLRDNKQYYESILVNPPRRGLNGNILKTIKELAPKNIIYSSCNVETLYNDWLNLEVDYNINSLRIFDMFPHTSHFETLMILSKKGSISV